jgi:uncharacterized protein (DUF433 family)
VRDGHSLGFGPRHRHPGDPSRHIALICDRRSAARCAFLPRCWRPARRWPRRAVVGTRAPLQNPIDDLSASDSLDAFFRSFPTVSREETTAALHQIGPGEIIHLLA